MSRATFPAAAVLILTLVVAAPASAQDQLRATSTTVELATPGEPLVAGSETVLDGKVTYEYPGTGQSESEPTTLRIQVLNAPAGVTATPEPAEVQVDLGGLAMSQTITHEVPFTVTLQVAEDAAEAPDGSLIVEAVAEENGLLQSSRGEVTVQAPVSGATDSDSLMGNVTDNRQGDPTQSETEGGNETPLPAALAAAALGLAARRRRLNG